MTMKMSQDAQRLSVQWMAVTLDRYGCGKVADVESVS